MAAPVVVDWNRSIKTIWAGRLARLGARESGDRDLPDAWTDAVASAAGRGWELRALVPLLDDPMNHRWAVVFGRGDEHPAPNLVLVHGDTPAKALRRSVDHLEAGIQMPERPAA